MSVKRVLQYGEKSLREPSKEVHKVSRKIQELVQDLLDTMYAKNGVGMAAPQIGLNYRVFVVDVSNSVIATLSANDVIDLAITTTTAPGGATITIPENGDATLVIKKLNATS